jgi:hypothetical protein
LSFSELAQSDHLPFGLFSGESNTRSFLNNSEKARKLKLILSERPVNENGIGPWFEWLGLRKNQGKLILLDLESSGKPTLLQFVQTGQFIKFAQDDRQAMVPSN